MPCSASGEESSEKQAVSSGTKEGERADSSIAKLSQDDDLSYACLTSSLPLRGMHCWETQKSGLISVVIRCQDLLFSFVNSAYPFVLQATSTLRLQLVSFRSITRWRYDMREIPRFDSTSGASVRLLSCAGRASHMPEGCFYITTFDDVGSLTHIMEGL